ncbi:MAG: inositol monophosphatase family protein [Bacteroidota bacterium]
MSISLSSVERQVIDLCRETGNFIFQEARNFDRGRIEQKGRFNNLVSYVDKESERRLVEALGKIIPGSGFLAEEGTETQGNEYQWIIDPLDGTTNFTHGMPPFAISIGLTFRDKLVLGVVHEVHASETFHSFEGAPVFCNEDEVRVAATTSLEQSLLATGFPYLQADKMDNHLQIIRTFLHQTHGIRRLGSAATDLAYVACGRLDGFFEYRLAPWDVAAGGFLVMQAGGRVTDFNDGPGFLHSGQLCAGNAVHPMMLEVIRRHWV